MKKLFLLILISVFCINTYAQKEPENYYWKVGINASGIHNNDFVKPLGLDKDFHPSFGFNIGFSIQQGKLQGVVDLGEELSSWNNNDINKMSLRTTLVSISAGYELFKLKQASISAKLGLGLFYNHIDYAYNSNSITSNTVLNQNCNLFIPVGLSCDIKLSQRESLCVDVLYRQSFKITDTKQYGNDSDLEDLDLHKLNCLSIGVSLISRF